MIKSKSLGGFLEIYLPKKILRILSAPMTRASSLEVTKRNTSIRYQLCTETSSLQSMWVKKSCHSSANPSFKMR